MNKRKDTMADPNEPKRIKIDCSYGERCYRKNPAHFREFSHPHLESILDSHTSGDYDIPSHLSLQHEMIKEQIEIILEKQLYTPKNKTEIKNEAAIASSSKIDEKLLETKKDIPITPKPVELKKEKELTVEDKMEKTVDKDSNSVNPQEGAREKMKSPATVIDTPSKPLVKDSNYRPIVPPSRRAEDYLKVVRPRNKMAAKHAACAPYHIFYTTITDSKDTHDQPFSITFLELLDSSLGELKCSLQINFMVEIGWLLAQYYFAGYSEKKLTILYGEECSDLKNINKKKPQVDAHQVTMPTPFGKHHTKMMIFCYEDGSLRVVISTANLYVDDWENRTQGLWFSPSCPELPAGSMPHDGESPTMFKRSLLRYLAHYHLPQLSWYMERVKRCDFSKINVFLIASVHGSHSDLDWGMSRAGALLKQHCSIPCREQNLWPLVAQASSIGSYGKEPRLWLTGDFQHNMCKIKDTPKALTPLPELKIIYPSLENVRQSHDGLLGGGCLPYAAEAHTKQMWLNSFLFQWKATSTYRNKAMPHIKSYLRLSKDNKMAAYYILTSANISKAAWGTVNKGNGALRVMSYEAGVLFLPRFVINEDFFPLEGPNRLIVPYDIPPTKYTSDMSPWVSDYLM